MRPSSCSTRPPIVSASSSEKRVPNASLNSSMRVSAGTVHERSASLRMPSASSTSYSSPMSPTICSSTSSIVSSPETPPYSSTTIAMWLCVSRNSLSSTLSRLLSGMNTAGRRHSRMSNASRSSSTKNRSRSLASRIPATSSRSSPTTGNREWPDSMTTGRIFSTGSSRLITTICERGTMTSRTWIPETSSTDSSISSTSPSIRPRSRASASTWASWSRSRGSPEIDSAMRRSQPREDGAEPVCS